jgi:hypothetical protein
MTALSIPSRKAVFLQAHACHLQVDHPERFAQDPIGGSSFTHTFTCIASLDLSPASHHQVQRLKIGLQRFGLEKNNNWRAAEVRVRCYETCCDVKRMAIGCSCISAGRRSIPRQQGSVVERTAGANTAVFVMAQEFINTRAGCGS